MIDKPLFLLDTNILIYAYEKEESKRKELAKKILEECYTGKILLAVSNQNIAEFTSIMLKKIKVDSEIIKKVIDITSEFDGFIKLKYELKTIKEAINLSNKYGMSFWDSLISATMLENGILNIFTENAKDFKIPSLNVINPFLD
jgi:predicted nucleic acid-binding protein